MATKINKRREFVQPVSDEWYGVFTVSKISPNTASIIMRNDSKRTYTFLKKNWVKNEYTRISEKLQNKKNIRMTRERTYTVE